jgi:hypothetical protein
MRTILTTLCLLFLSTFVIAQEASPAITTATTTIGIRAGYGTSSIRTDSELDAISDRFDNASALSFGVFANIPLGEVLSLRPGLELNRRGTTLDISADQEVFGINLPLGARAKTRFTYVDVPLLVQATLPTAGIFKPYVFGGGSIGYATSGNVRTTATVIVEFNLMTSDIDLDAINYERFNAAAIGGLGVKAELSTGFNIFFEGRFEQSLTEPYNVPLLTAKTGFKGLNFGAGVSFAL